MSRDLHAHLISLTINLAFNPLSNYIDKAIRGNPALIPSIREFQGQWIRKSPVEGWDKIYFCVTHSVLLYGLDFFVFSGFSMPDLILLEFVVGTSGVGTVVTMEFACE